MDRAWEIAEIVNRNAPLAVRGTRLAIRKTLSLPTYEAELLAENYRMKVAITDDAQEAARAFLEKRDPGLEGPLAARPVRWCDASGAGRGVVCSFGCPFFRRFVMSESDYRFVNVESFDDGTSCDHAEPAGDPQRPAPGDAGRAQRCLPARPRPTTTCGW